MASSTTIDAESPHGPDRLELDSLRREVELLRLRNAQLEELVAARSSRKELLSSSVECTQDALVVADRAGAILFYNERATSVLNVSAGQGSTCSTGHSLTLARCLPQGCACLKAHDFAARTGEGIVITEEREGRLFECRSLPVVLDGVFQIIVGYFDITERDHTRQLLLQTQRVLEEKIASRNIALQVQVQERMRAEEALRREQGFIRLVLDTDPSCVSVYDAQGVPILVNRAFADLFGFRDDAVLSEVFQDYAPAWGLVENSVQQVCHTGETVRQERALEDEMGTYRWYDTVTTPLCLPSGEIYALSIATDVTGRKVSQLALEQAHSELEERVKERTVALAEVNGRLVREAMERLEAQKCIEENEARFRSLFFANQAIKLLIDTEDGRILEANQAALDFYGYPREVMVGLSIYELTLASTDLVRTRRDILVGDGTASFESRHKRRDGTVMDVEVYAGMVADKGRRTVFAIVHEITERKRAERLVVEQRNHLTALMNALGDSAMLLDVRGGIMTLNTAAAASLHRNEEALVGTVLFDAMPSAHRAPHRRMFKEVLSKGRPVRDELSLQDAVWDATYYPVLDAMEQVAGVALYCKDITARKKSEERMRWLSARVLSAQEEERKRIGRELHDSTAQTLSGIKFMVEADLAAMERAMVPHDTKIIRKVVSLLQGAIIELRRIIMDLRPTVLDDLGLFSALRWLQDEFCTMNVAISFRIWLDMDEDCLTEMQKSVLFRVAQEGIANVARHSKADALSLSLTRDQATCFLTISDNGVGFALDECNYSGIGLDSMRERLELVDGHLVIESEHGKGTQVRAVVPLRSVISV